MFPSPIYAYDNELFNSPLLYFCVTLRVQCWQWHIEVENGEFHFSSLILFLLHRWLKGIFICHHHSLFRFDTRFFFSKPPIPFFPLHQMLATRIHPRTYEPKFVSFNSLLIDVSCMHTSPMESQKHRSIDQVQTFLVNFLLGKKIKTLPRDMI